LKIQEGTMTEELEQLLKNLRLKRMLEILDEQLRAAEKEDLSYSELLVRLLRPEWHSRQEQSLKARIERAHLPELWTLETFPYAKQPGVNRRQIRAFAELDFIPKAENIVFIGKTGVGKTGLACGILLKALENGYRVLVAAKKGAIVANQREPLRHGCVAEWLRGLFAVPR